MTSVQRASVIALVLFVAGCGGDDGVGNLDTSGPTTEPGTGDPASGDDDGTPGSSDTGPGSTGGDGSSSTGADDLGTTAADDTTASDDTAGSESDTGTAAPTWDSFAAAFFETYCWECHGPGDPLRDYSTLAAVMAESSSIRCGTAPAGANLPDCAGEPPEEQFPVGATLPTADERAMLVAWIDAGLPEN